MGQTLHSAGMVEYTHPPCLVPNLLQSKVHMEMDPVIPAEEAEANVHRVESNKALMFTLW